MLAKIECGIVRLPFVLERNSLALGRNPRDIFLIEVIWDFKEGIFEFPFGLANEVIDLARRDPGESRLSTGCQGG